MPRYRYQCPCGVQFEATNKAANHSDPKPCPECSVDAARMMPKAVEGHFNKTVDGPGPQNTGIHDLDTHIDRVIGQSARQGMEAIEARQKAKREFLRDNPGLNPKHIARTPDGELAVNKPEEQDFAVRANRINSLAMKNRQAASEEPAR